MSPQSMAYSYNIRHLDTWCTRTIRFAPRRWLPYNPLIGEGEGLVEDDGEESA